MYWDSLITLCKQIKKDGLVPLGLGNLPRYPGAGWFDAINLGVNGYDFHLRLLAGQESFLSPQVSRVFDLWRQVVPYFNPGVNKVDIPDLLPQFAQGNPVILYDSSVHANRAAATARLTDLDFFPFPAIDPLMPSTVEAPAEGFMASAHSRNPRGARALLAYMARPDVQSRQANGLKDLPVNTEAPLPSDALNQKGLALIRSASHISQYFDRDSSPAFSDPALTALQQFYDNPATAAAVQRTWDQQMKLALSAG